MVKSTYPWEVTPPYPWEVTSTYPSKVISTYSSVLTTDSQTYRHTDYVFSTDEYYEAIEVKVFMEGKYSFTSTSLLDTYGYIYKYSFDPFNQKWNYSRIMIMAVTINSLN